MNNMEENGRTICWWFKKLPLEIRNGLMNNVTSQRGNMHETASSLAEAIDFAITWNRTPEGKSYWLEVYCKYRRDGDKPRSSFINSRGKLLTSST